MQCTNCGTPIPDLVMSCPNCGAPAGSSQQSCQQGGQILSKKEFLKLPNMKSCKSNLTGSAVILYICGALSLTVGMLGGNPFVIVDVLIIIGMGLGIQLGQSRACAIIVCVYAAFNTIVMLLNTGRISGYLILIAAIYAIMATFRFQKVWKDYQTTGILPAAR